jgi:hypothetical protein
MATFYDQIPEKGQVKELALFVSRLRFAPDHPPKDDPRLEEYKCLVRENKYEDIMEKLLEEDTLLYTKAESEEIEQFFSVFSTLLIKLGNTTREKVAKKLIQSLTNDTEEKSAVRLAILRNMYNLHEEPTWRYTIFLAVLEYAAKSGQADSVLPLLEPKKLEERLKEWDISAEKLRTLYSTVLENFEDLESAVVFEIVENYLKTFESSTEEEISKYSESIKSYTILLVQSSSEYGKLPSLLSLKAVKWMENPQITTNGSEKAAFQLFKTFTCGSPSEFKNFADNNRDHIEQWEFDSDECFSKMKSLSLAATCFGKSVVSYEDISKELNIELEEIENCIVEAIASGLVDGRMDQPGKKFFVRKADQRSVTKEQWQQLQGRLNNWTTNMKSLMGVVRDLQKETSLPAPQVVKSN